MIYNLFEVYFTYSVITNHNCILNCCEGEMALAFNKNNENNTTRRRIFLVQQ